MTHTVTISKPKYQEFICGVNDKELIAVVKKYEKQGYTVETTEERPYPKV